MTDQIPHKYIADRIAADIERGQRRHTRPKPPPRGNKTIVTSEGVFHEDASGNRRPAGERFARERQLQRDIDTARAAFDRAVAQDFANAMSAYLDLCDALHRAGSANSAPPFTDLLNQAASKAAIARRVER